MAEVVITPAEKRSDTTRREAALGVPLGLGHAGKVSAGTEGGSLQMAFHSAPVSPGVWSRGDTQACACLTGPSTLNPPHLHLIQEGVSQVSGWLGPVPGHPVLDDQLINQDHEGSLPREDLGSQPWDTQEHGDCFQHLWGSQLWGPGTLWCSGFHLDQSGPSLLQDVPTIDLVPP